MEYTNSPLVSHVNLSPNHSGRRTHAIDRISPHCVVGQCTVETLGEIFKPTSRQASSNYGIGKDGKIGMYVEEKNRSWCTSSGSNDQRAITIEVASDTAHPYAMKDVAYNSLIELCVDICKRYGKTKLIWFADKDKTLKYEPASDEMVITVHRWFANKSCPGDWLYSRLGDLAAKVTAKLGGATEDKVEEPKEEAEVIYRVQVGAYSKKENAEAMAAKLRAVGYDTIIKTEIKETPKKEEPKQEAVVKKSNAEIAKEIYKGICSDSRWSTWGNGATRVERLTAAGYDAVAVQKEVNKLF